ncbi:cystatin-POGU1 [Osmerus eperlanus]|uniref:cystatin-POGU1 n=1 Tax=Osmerus eperlanus TaxID=29151 RepID=UPI002E1348A8
MEAFSTILRALVLVIAVLAASSEQQYGSDVKEAANFAVGFHNRMSNCTYAYKVIAILLNTSQIYPPARVKYTMTVQVGQTVCKNEPTVNLADCSLQNAEDSKTMTCHFVVMAVPHSDVPSYLLEDQCH